MKEDINLLNDDTITKKVDEVLNKEVESKLLKIAEKNNAIRIHNPQNFFGKDKAIFSVKVDLNANMYFFILRPFDEKEPNLKKLKSIVNNKNTEPFNFLFNTSDHYIKSEYILGKMIDNHNL